jgi:hypothetical protein
MTNVNGLAKKKGALSDAFLPRPLFKLELRIDLLDLGIELERMLAKFAPEA